MKKWIFTIGVIFCVISAFATELEIQRFRANEEDQTALTEKRFDRQQRMCALIKVQTDIQGLRFSSDPVVVYQTVNPDSSGYWVFLSPQQNNLTLRVEGAAPLKYTTPILQSGRVYEMEVIAHHTSEARKGTIYIKCTPQAEIFLNDSSYGFSPKFITGLPIGTYAVRLTAEGFKDYVNQKVVVEENATTDVIATLYGIGRGGSSFTATSTPTSKESEKSQRASGSSKSKSKNNGWFGGISLGMVKANNYTANYYSGSKDDYNSINYYLSGDYWQTRYEDIKECIGHDFDTTNIGTPSDMSYGLAASFGLYGGFVFDKKNRILLSFDYHRLKTNDILMLYYVPGTSPGNEVGTQCSITGKEDRFNIDLGYSREFTAGQFTTWYLMAGVNVNNVVVQSNDMYVPITVDNSNRKEKYSIMRSVYNPDGSVYDEYTGGVGYGIFGALGFRLLFTEFFSLDPEFKLNFTKSGISQYYKNIPSVTHYDKFKFSFQLSIRINLFNTGAKKSDDYD